MWNRVLNNRHTINNVEFIGFHHERHTSIKCRDDESTRNEPNMVTYEVVTRLSYIANIVCLLLSNERIIVFTGGTEFLVFNNASYKKCEIILPSHVTGPMIVMTISFLGL